MKKMRKWLYCIFSFILFTTNLCAQEWGQGAGFCRNEGEYISGQVWSSEDTIGLGVSSVISVFTGEIVIDIYQYAAKYALSTFFARDVLPLEIWIDLIETWPYATLLGNSDEFKPMCGLFVEQRADITWIQAECQYLTIKNHWNDPSFNPIPWAYQDDNAALNEFDGGLQTNPPTNVNQSPLPSVARFTAGINPAEFVEVPSSVAMEGMSSKLFEKLVNAAAREGYLEASLGLPKGSFFVDLGYGSGCGTDGFFVAPGNTRSYLLEMKWYKKGGGRLGLIRGPGFQVRQTSPEWLQKAMVRVARERPEHYASLMKKFEGTNFGEVLGAAQNIESKLDEIVEKEIDAAHPGLKIKDEAEYTRLCKRLKANIENYADPDLIKGILKKYFNYTEERLARIGNYFGQEIVVSILNKTGKMPRHLDEIRGKLKNWAEVFGGEYAEKITIKEGIEVERTVAQGIKLAEEVAEAVAK